MSKKNKIAIEVSYYSFAQSRVVLPDGKSSDDIDWEETFIKWNEINIFFKDGTSFSEELSSEFKTDSKRPSDYSVYKIDESNNVDYCEPILEG